MRRLPSKRECERAEPLHGRVECGLCHLRLEMTTTTTGVLGGANVQDVML